MYLVGRHDGTVEPFFAKVWDRRTGSEVLRDALDGGTPTEAEFQAQWRNAAHTLGFLEIIHNPDVTALVERARDDDGWWWRRMTIGVLPDQQELDKLPPLYGPECR